MTGQVYTAEEKLERLEDAKTIEKLVSKRSFLGLLKQSDLQWKDFWCSAEAEPVLGVNDGYYSGYAAIEGYYNARHSLTVLKTELIQAANPEKFADKSIEEILGVGSLTMDNLSTQIIEVAKDGKTAKGLWYVVVIDVDLGLCGSEANWEWGRVGIDFLKEDGQWKIWHMVYAEDIKNLMGTDWTKEREIEPAKAEYAALADFKMPQPNVPCTVHESYYKKRPVLPFPAVPMPYDAFEETFTYGMREEDAKC